MSREIRRVSADWQHPKGSDGRCIPLDKEFLYSRSEIKEGLREGWLVDEPPHYGIRVMPQWSPEEATHYQMYECTTEGTPISPVFATPEEVARWCADNGASAMGSQPASYEGWLRVAKGGYAPTMICTPETGIVSGVEGMTKK